MPRATPIMKSTDTDPSPALSSLLSSPALLTRTPSSRYTHVLPLTSYVTLHCHVLRRLLSGLSPDHDPSHTSPLSLPRSLPRMEHDAHVVSSYLPDASQTQRLFGSSRVVSNARVSIKVSGNPSRARALVPDIARSISEHRCS